MPEPSALPVDTAPPPRERARATAGAAACAAASAAAGLGAAMLAPRDVSAQAAIATSLVVPAIALLALKPARPRLVSACAALLLLPLAARLLVSGPAAAPLALGCVAVAAALALAAMRLARQVRAMSDAAAQAGSLRASLARAEDAARQAREDALAAHQAVEDRNRFLAAASHDLRQPVHAIGLFVGALKEEIRDGRARYLIDRLDRSMLGLDELFHRLLDLSRLDAGAVEPRISVFAIGPMLQTLESRFVQVAEQRGLRLRVRPPPPCAVRTDPALLIEILMNLLSNAFRYTERGGIVLGARRRGDRLLIQVWDTGPGIAADAQEAIFREFVQLGRSTRDRRHGLGLGLAIVRRLAGLLDCPVRVRSRPGRGSVFEISVPASAEPVAAPPPGAPVPAPDALQGMLVLVVDDEMDILVGMEAILASWGCFVILARTVDEARRHLSEAQRFPDLLITDHRLADGHTSEDVAAVLAEQVPVPVPVIVLSGDVGAPLMQRARARGWSLLGKPVNPERLRALATRLTAGA